jgi:nucleotide-binding universal stress UspA family protein
MERILVALDGSEHSEKALDLACDIAGKYGAEVVLLHVMSDKPLTDAEREMAEVEYLDDLLASLSPPETNDGGDPRIRAQRVLRRYADLAHRFRQAVGERLIGQARTRVSHKVAHLAGCTCVSVK